MPPRPDVCRRWLAWRKRLLYVARVKSSKQKNPAAVALGRLGGSAGKGQAKARTPEQARNAGKAGALVRWADHVKKAEPGK